MFMKNMNHNNGINLYVNMMAVDASEKLPELYNNKEECCGCSACYAICPHDAIEMREDLEGFLYPVIDTAICVRCYKCVAVCSFKVDQKKKNIV